MTGSFFEQSVPIQKKIRPYLDRLMMGDWKTGSKIPLWNRKPAERIVGKLIEIC